MSISASESAATLDQSVLEVGVKALSLMAGGLFERYDSSDVRF
jgi:hypothetical protein